MFEYKGHKYNDKIDNKNLDNYEKLDRIGKGGFGKIYLCKDKKTSKKVVIKKVREDKYAYIEVLILRMLSKQQNKLKNKDSILEYIDAIKHKENVFIIMKRIDGITLNEFIKDKYYDVIYQSSVFTISDVHYILKIAKYINSLIKDIHSLGILHLDVKGSNIMIKFDDKDNHKNKDKNKDNYKLYLIDYGLSRLKHDDSMYGIESIHGVLGTHTYISPEILNKTYEDIGYHTDIYSFGMILYYIFFKDQFNKINGLNERQLREHKIKTLSNDDIIEDVNDKYPTNNKDLNYKLIKLISGMLYEDINYRYNHDDIKKRIKEIIQ